MKSLGFENGWEEDGKYDKYGWPKIQNNYKDVVKKYAVPDLNDFGKYPPTKSTKKEHILCDQSELDENLKINDVKIFKKIIRLCTIRGYESDECYAGNNYFSKLFNISISTIKRSLKKLQDQKYINVNVTKIFINNLFKSKRIITVNLFKMVDYEQYDEFY